MERLERGEKNHRNLKREKKGEGFVTDDSKKANEWVKAWVER